MDDEEGRYGRGQPEDAWNEDKRKSYVKRMIKESKDLPEQFKRPDYKENMDGSSAEEEESISAQPDLQTEEAISKKYEGKKKKEYEL